MGEWVLRLLARHLHDASIGRRQRQLGRCELTAPHAARIQAHHVVAHHQPARRPVSKDDRRAACAATGHVEPRHVAVRRAVGIRRLELHRAVGLAETQAGEGVDRQAQAVHADEIGAPLVGLVAKRVGQEGLPVCAAQLPLDCARELQHVAGGPLGQYPGMDHQEAVLEDRQRLMAQPRDELVAIRCGQDVGDGVALAGLAYAGSDRQEMDVVVAQDGAGPPRLA